MNESWPHIYKKPAEPHCPLQVVPEEVIGTTHRSRDYSVWESDTLHWDSRQHCTGRSLLPKGWATLAVPAWLTTRIAMTPNERVCQQFRIIVPAYCGANSALIATRWELHSWWQRVPVYPLFCKVPFCAGFAHHAGASYQRRLLFTRKTSSSIRNKHAAGAVLGVGLSVGLGLNLPNLAASLLSCHSMDIIFVSTLASSDDSNYTNNFEVIRWESLEWSRALQPCGQTLCKALNSLPSLSPAFFYGKGPWLSHRNVHIPILDWVTHWALLLPLNTHGSAVICCCTYATAKHSNSARFNWNFVY